ncbi:tRNA lysidine(34) synthetase TilS [Paraglaciecola sp. L3A3]|uniref:tRNA lysidine(34) synthetase TilS n=1 Tax=Paraglaciecola sp. L3A3 TaxID=2686358 RepID=UPI00131E55EB|nr:tRNA lysidine(34) synthetase TilS [Paraglaciecola sp. L3A3]
MKILNTLKKHLATPPLNNASVIVVAYSGGVDSHVLLHALSVLQKEFKFNLQAIHIHHGLSAFADDWLQHCQQVCDSLNVPLQSAKVVLHNASRTSLEAIARDERYKKIVELAPENAQVLVAQHQDDQLETFMLQLKRGAGPKGLSSMNQAWTIQGLEQKAVSFYRPLLDTTQQDVLAYAEQHQLHWCEDESNKNTDFDRNFLRHDVLPVLQKRWPELAKSVSRSAFLCGQQQDLLDEICAEKLAAVQNADNSLVLQALLELSNNWLHQVVRYWLSVQGIQSPPLAVINQLKPEVLQATDDAQPILQWQNWQFRRFNQQLFVIPVQVELAPVSIQWAGEAQVPLPAELGILEFNVDDAEIPEQSVLVDQDQGPIFIELASYNKRFKPAKAAHSKPLKQWFKLWRIAPWQRSQVIQLVQNNKILALYLNGQWRVADCLTGDVKQSIVIYLNNN